MAPEIWKPLPVGVGREEITALALETPSKTDRATAWLAVGTRRGVLLGRVGDPFTRVLHRGPVRGLVFAPGPSNADRILLASTEGGLHRIHNIEKTTFSPGPGARARLAGRMAADSGLIAVATAAGAFVSVDSRSWQSLSDSLPAGDATTVAIRRRTSLSQRAGSEAHRADFECWTVIRGRLWRTPLELREGRLFPGPSRQEPLPFAAADRGPLDVVFGLPDGEIVVVLPRMLARSRESGRGWDVIRIGVPPGASIVRLAYALDRYWLATDRGLLHAARLDGPWRRAASPVGTTAIRDLVGNRRLLLVATATGVWTGSAASRNDAERSTPALPVPAPPGPAPIGGDDPRIEDLHRVATAFLDLENRRFRGLAQKVNRRGWLPLATLRGGYDGDRDRSRDTDEAFVSGDLRRLNDSDRRRSRNWDLTLTLTWDLADLAYHPELIDVSKETRALIELRDDVLDEITQLYFERRRVLAEIGASQDPATRARLRLRADELAAGIDAWTGGWFSQHTLPPVP